MNLSLYIAKRYLFSKKKHNSINIISAISVCGVALATLALICTLSVFNGFEEMVSNSFTTFDPELKISTVEGKVFHSDSDNIKKALSLSSIDITTKSIEENAMVQYKNQQAMVVLKGVEDNFTQLTDIDKVLYGSGEFLLKDSVVSYAVMGGELLGKLGTGLKFVYPLKVYTPKRRKKINLANPLNSFNKGYLYSPGVIFVVNQHKYDSRYILTSLTFVRSLLNYTDEVSSIELKLKEGSNLEQTKNEIKKILGDKFVVENRYEQQADIFKIMEIEKLIAFLFLIFILIIACFNIISSVSMLIIDKKEDMQTLHKLGASDKLITKIFLFEGYLILILGASIGLILGISLCLIQQHFGFVTLGDASHSFIVDQYPVSVHIYDVIIIFITVTLIGFLSIWYPIHYLHKKLLR